MAVNAYTPIASNGYSTGLNQTSQSLTSGQRINNAADDAAGQAIVTALTTQINSQDVGTRNANDGISLLQTADGATKGIGQSLQRMNELTIQSLNGTLNQSQRNILNNEFQQNIKNINDIAGTTSFNGNNLLNGDTASVDIALGESSSSLTLPTLTSDSLSLTGLNISNSTDATAALEGITNAIEQLSTAQSEFGAQQNGLTSAIENLQSQNVNNQATRSQINDTDYAKASADQFRQDVLTQSAIAMQSHRNNSQAQVLQLLN